MSLFKVTVFRDLNTSNVRLHKGMSVEVSIYSPAISNPITWEGGKAIKDAFMRIYGIDISGPAWATVISALKVEKLK